MLYIQSLTQVVSINGFFLPHCLLLKFSEFVIQKIPSSMKCLLTHLSGTQNTPINLSVVNWSFYLVPNQDLKNMYNYKKTEGDDRGWDGWMASLTQWTWVWVNSGSWWWTGRPGVLQPMGLNDWTKLTKRLLTKTCD